MNRPVDRCSAKQLQTTESHGTETCLVTQPSRSSITDVPETPHLPRERGRVTARGRRTDDRSLCTLLVIHEADSSWAIHGLGVPGVRLSKADMVVLAEEVLKRAR